MTPPAISVRGVSHRFPGRGRAGEVKALEGVSLDVPAGEFVCLIGPSGCGKSTLLGIIGGLIASSEGEAAVMGKAVRGPAPGDIAFVFQESTLLPWYTILENFRIALKFQGVRAEWRERAMTALASVGMAGFADHYPNQLSVGMKQRINLSRSLALDTPIVLMDEPFAALDEQTRLVLGEDLSVLLARTAKTIVFVTHSLSEAVFLADRIFVMTARPGRIKEVIAVEEPHPRSPDFMLEGRFAELRNRLFAALRDEIRQTVAAMREARDLALSDRP